MVKPRSQLGNRNAALDFRPGCSERNAQWIWSFPPAEIRVVRYIQVSQTTAHTVSGYLPGASCIDIYKILILLRKSSLKVMLKWREDSP
jgi:hypothetical protein